MEFGHFKYYKKKSTLALLVNLVNKTSFFSTQDIEDNRFTLTTQFLKRSTKGIHGGDWTARITATPRDPKQSVIISLMFYALLPEGPGFADGGIDGGNSGANSNLRGIVRSGEHLEEIVGDTPETGPFSISFLSTGASAENVLKYNYLSAFVPSPEVNLHTLWLVTCQFMILPANLERLDFVTSICSSSIFFRRRE